MLVIPVAAWTTSTQIARPLPHKIGAVENEDDFRFKLQRDVDTTRIVREIDAA